MLAVDLSKGSFQVCAVGPDGTVLYNRALSRSRFAALLADQPACVVAMEACATSHHWGRVAQASGHEVRLVPAVYVKPFVKRQKNDRADAEAIPLRASRWQGRRDHRLGRGLPHGCPRGLSVQGHARAD
ncbi:transposase [Methylobacterium sp. D54C]